MWWPTAGTTGCVSTHRKFLCKVKLTPEARRPSGVVLDTENRELYVLNLHGREVGSTLGSSPDFPQNFTYVSHHYHHSISTDAIKILIFLFNCLNNVFILI